jgi:acyl carrier protein
MANLDILKRTFQRTLGLGEEVDLMKAAYGWIDGWDSVAHMQLIAAIEEAFDVMLETDKVIAMCSCTQPLPAETLHRV